MQRDVLHCCNAPVQLLHLKLRQNTITLRRTAITIIHQNISNQVELESVYFEKKNGLNVEKRCNELSKLKSNQINHETYFIFAFGCR